MPKIFHDPHKNPLAPSSTYLMFGPITKPKRHFHCLLKTLKYKYCPKFRTSPNKSIIYRPGIYNVQTRNATFPDQEKIQVKIDLRYLKMLETKKLNTQNPQIKHCT